jgi:pimeloyl-ACP methyl ester carboxylesterase
MITLAARFQRRALRRQGFQVVEVVAPSGRVHVLEAIGGGSLPTVVLLHGLGSAGIHYGPLLERLRPHFRRLVAPDLPGHGFSPLPHGGHDPVRIAEALFGALDDRLEAPSILFGNSLGGYTALLYAVRRPERVRGLVLCSPAGAPLKPHEMAEIRRLLSVRTHRDALELVDRLQLRHSRLRHLFAWGARRQLGAESVQGLLGDVAPDRFLRPEELSALSMPVLLLWGRQEHILPASGLAYFREHLPPHAVIETPDGWGHSPYVQDPGPVARRIVAFARTC